MLSILPVLGGFAVYGADVVVLPASAYAPVRAEAIDFRPGMGGACVPSAADEGIVFVADGTPTVTILADERAEDPLHPDRERHTLTVRLGEPCDVDFNGRVDVHDLLAFLGQFREWYDFNADGRSDARDLLEFLGRFRGATG